MLLHHYNSEGFTFGSICFNVNIDILKCSNFNPWNFPSKKEIVQPLFLLDFRNYVTDTHTHAQRE